MKLEETTVGTGSPFVSQKLHPFSASENARDLTELTKLIEHGKVTPVIDRTYPLSQTANAFSYYQRGHTRGKIAISVPETKL